MTQYFKFIFLLVTSSVLAISCANDIAEVDALTESLSITVETGKNIKMLYSDSAVIKVRITADSLVRYVDKVNPRDVFPSGIFIEFLSPHGKPTSWLEADRAVRSEKQNTFVASGNVRFYNKEDEKLISTELIWDEAESILHTEKLVAIVQPAKGDTTYGFGFTSNEEFNIFELRRRTSGVFTSADLQSAGKD